VYYEYAHGGDIYDEKGRIDEDIIDFSANINPLGMPKEALLAAKSALASSNIYPDSDCRQLGAKLAEFENVDQTNIFCGAGASDILFRLAFAVKPKKILVTAPSFADYERAGRAAGAEVICYALKKDNDFDIEKDIVDLIAETSPDIVFVCNPNNPTGNLTDAKMLKEIADACQFANAILLSDECFLDFVCDLSEYSAKSLIEKYENIMILKAFTKIFAMPGLRLGYAICKDMDLINKMRFCGPDWAVSNVAQKAGLAALRVSEDYLENTRKYIREQRKYITEELKNLGFAVYMSQANFIFFHCPHKLDLKNIKIRDCSDFRGLGPGYYRVAVLTAEKNKLLIEALKGAKNLWQNR